MPDNIGPTDIIGVDLKIGIGFNKWYWSVSYRDRPIYRSIYIIGRYLTFWISADIRISTDIFTDILVWLFTQFVPNSSWFSKNLRILLKFVQQNFFRSCFAFFLVRLP